MTTIRSAFSIWPSSKPDDLEKIKAQIDEENNKFGIIWSAAQILYWGFCYLMSLSGGMFALSRTAYGTALAVCSVILLCLLFLVPRMPGLKRPMVYIVAISMLGAGLWISLVQLQENARTAVLFASVLIVPIMFICDTFSVAAMILTDMIAFCVIVGPRVDTGSFEWAGVNLFIFGTGGVLLGHFINKARAERFVFAESAVQLAELQTKYAYYDQMTGLFNRRAYSERITELLKKLPEHCCVVNADNNGLKEINDSYGHAAGDEMICGVAECLKRGFEGRGDVYRLGGDEFGAIMTGTAEDAEKCMKRVEELCKAWKGRSIQGISLSYGIASSEEFSDISSLTKAADERMYVFKQNYYLTTGKKRRRR